MSRTFELSDETVNVILAALMERPMKVVLRAYMDIIKQMPQPQMKTTFFAGGHPVQHNKEHDHGKV